MSAGPQRPHRSPCTSGSTASALRLLGDSSPTENSALAAPPLMGPDTSSEAIPPPQALAKPRLLLPGAPLAENELQDRLGRSSSSAKKQRGTAVNSSPLEAASSTTNQRQRQRQRLTGSAVGQAETKCYVKKQRSRCSSAWQLSPRRPVATSGYRRAWLKFPPSGAQPGLVSDVTAELVRR